MKAEIRQIAKAVVRHTLSAFDLEISRRSTNPTNYISFRKTLKAAKRAGMQVGEFIEQIHNVPGTTQRTIDKMKLLGVFDGSIRHVVEIGPGSGRYLERTLKICGPVSYEIYETASEWRGRLEKRYAVVSHIPDGSSLRETPTNSVDLVQAHKVFPILSIMTICKYMEEMARVTRENGWIVFDVFTEKCLAREEIPKWTSQPTYVVSMVSRSFVVDFMRQRGLALKGEFFADMLPGKTHCFVFTKNLHQKPSTPRLRKR